MIRLDMTREELLNELNMDLSWAMDRVDGISIKYKRILNDKKRPDGIFHHCWYTTPRNNRVCVIYEKKRVAGDVCVNVNAFFKVLGDDGKERYIMNHFYLGEHYVKECFLFTNHFVQRLRERVGMDFESWFIERVRKKEETFEVFDYDYNGVDNQC